MLLRCYGKFNVSVYYRVILLGKAAVIKSGAYIVSMDRKTTVYRLEASKIAFFEKRVQAVPSNAFPYFIGLPVSVI